MLATLALTLFALANGPVRAEAANAVFAPFDPLLRAHVVAGQVDYPAFAAADDFKDLVQTLASAVPDADATQAERLAFYINAYNVMSIQGILDGYSPSSIWGRLRFFKRRKYDLFGTSMSLFDLEHDRIISEGEPRIHFAIVCASQSCPPLQSTIYTVAGLDAELDAAATGFINDPANNRFDAGQRKAELSSIFKWYRDEFEAAGGGSLGGYLAQYVTDEAVANSLRSDDWSFKFQDYDWSLNGTPLAR
ncbi:MAG: DUF547 domain-containing protein [Pseudomonadota bacterium]